MSDFVYAKCLQLQLQHPRLQLQNQRQRQQQVCGVPTGACELFIANTISHVYFLTSVQ